MESTFLSFLLPPLLLVPAMGILSRGKGGGRLGAELRRKSLHIGTGLIALVFPVLFDEGWPVFACLGLVIAWMIAVRRWSFLRHHFGRVLHDAERESRGEFWFAAAVAMLLLVTDGGCLYVIPLLILTLADAAAAIAGSVLPRLPLRGAAAGKTVAGSAAFLLGAFAVTAAGVSFMAGTPFTATAKIAICVAVLTTAAEALSGRGTDNLSVPLVAWLILQLLLPVPGGGLQ